MAHYTTPLQPSYSYQPAPTYPAQHTVYPSYSLPAISQPPLQQTMPTYYVQSNPSSHSHHRGRSYSHSGHHQPVVYTTSGSGRHLSSRDYAYADSGRRHRSSSVGHGGHYIHPSSHGYSTTHRSSSRSPTYYAGSSGRRSHSTTRHHHSPSGVQYVDAHRRSGSRRPSVSYSDSGHRRHHSDSIGDRFLRWFGLGSSSHHHSRPRGTEYVDARSGRPVDRSGRPVYRV